MRLIDMHCDTIYELFYSEKELYNGDFKINIEKMIRGGYTAQFFATFFDLEDNKNAFETANKMMDKFFEEIDKNNKFISLARKYNDIESNGHNNKISAFLTIEEGGAIENKISNIEHFYNRGVRLMGITWNYENSLGYPHCSESLGGLKPFGKQAVECMNDLGIIVDVSHLSDEGFQDVYNISKSYVKPFVASHSNAREITQHSRNLTDDMIKKIGETGGVIGLNFASDFLGDSSIARIKDMVYHLKHIRNKGGIECICLGSDFDGINNEVEIKDASYMIHLEDILLKHEFSQNDIEKIMYKNSIRVIADIIG